MNRRGITLTEVLVAIFVTGLGLMALMTLFPLGAVNMALAVKDDRAQHAAANASAYLRTIWRQGLDSGNPNLFFYPSMGVQPVALQGGPAYLDPIGQMNYGPTSVGGVIPRIGLSWTAPAVPANKGPTYQYFSLLDDIQFGYNGAPVPAGQLPRETLYTWAYMLRPLLGDPRGVDYSVAVYNRRSPSQQRSEVPWAGPAMLIPGYNNAISVAGQLPKKGGWVLDAASGFFYRVDSVTPGSLKLDQPLRTPGPYAIVVMTDVIAVFDKSTLE